MRNELPDWADDKEKEGMKAFLDIVEEYGMFEVTFKQSTFADDMGFEADVRWFSFDTHGRAVPFSIYWNYEQLFNHLNEKVNTWQFVFSDSGFEMSGQLFYMELFQRLNDMFDKSLKTKPNSAEDE